MTGHQLTQQGRKILSALCAGRTRKEVAAELGVSVKTIDHQLTRHRHKWQARTTVELVTKVLASGACKESPNG